jgi:hypothetical protein
MKHKSHSESERAAIHQRDVRFMEMLKDVRNLVVNRVCDIEPEPINWLWPGRIPRGQLTLLAGDAGSGKSLMALDLAARVSRGAAWPDSPTHEQRPGNVLVLTAHSDPHAVGRPRLERAGADLSRVFFATGVERRENASFAWKRQVSLPDDLMSLTKAIYARRPMPLVVLDPAWVFCSRGRGRSKLAGPALLAELAELACNLRVAMLCVTDLRRDGQCGLGFRAAGDRALLAAAPTAWGLVRDPQQPQRRLMLPLKTNTGPEEHALSFQIDDGRIEWDPKPATITGAAILAAERASGEPAGAGAEEWLQAFLANGPQPATEVIRQGRECGFSEVTLRRAKSALHVASHKRRFDGGSSWSWELAGDSSVNPGESGDDGAKEGAIAFANGERLPANSRESLEGAQLSP